MLRMEKETKNKLRHCLFRRIECYLPSILVVDRPVADLVVVGHVAVDNVHRQDFVRMHLDLTLSTNQRFSLSLSLSHLFRAKNKSLKFVLRTLATGLAVQMLG